MNQEVHIPLTEHFNALRDLIFKSLVVVIIGMCAAFLFYKPLFDFLLKPALQIESSPLQKETYHRYHNKTDHFVTFQSTEIAPGDTLEVKIPYPIDHLALFSPLEGMTLTFKVCFWFGLIATSPFWLGLVVRFIFPALTPYETQLIFPFFLLSLGALILGIITAFKFTLPFANQYFYQFNTSFGINLWSVSQYIQYTLSFLVAHAVAFEICAILLFLIHHNIISGNSLRQKRRVAIVVAFILGAVLTPPDIFTQLIMSGLLIGVYELGILYASLRKKEDQSACCNCCASCPKV